MPSQHLPHSTHASSTSYETGFETDPLVVVLGSEGNGLSRLVREACESIAGIPMSNMVESLNASVAAGITLYAVARARRVAAAAM